MSNINKIMRDKLTYLNDNGINASMIEVRMLMSDILNTDIGCLRFFDKDITEEQLNKFEKYIEKRKNFWPVDKILGKKGFYKLDFLTSEDVLSPRSDTEILIDEALKLFCLSDNINILELGTGSGCIIISLLFEYKNAKALGIDISDKALNITKKNAENNLVLNRLNLLNKSWFDEDLLNVVNQKFDIIISNPPYIPSADIKNLDNEVKNFDPIIALDGGEDGLRDYKQICALAQKLLHDHGYLIFETGINQADDVIKIAEKNGLKQVKIAKDYNNIDRCVILKK